MNYFIYTSHQSIVPWLLYQSTISFLEPTCLLVSTKTRSNQFPGFKILEVSVSRRMRELVYTKMASRDRVDVDAFHKDPQRHSIRIGKTRKLKFDFERAAVSNFKSERHEDSGNEIVIIPELRVLVLTKRQVGSGDEIDQFNALFDRVFVFTAQAWRN